MIGKKLLFLFLLSPIILFSQLNFFFSGSLGYLNNTAISLASGLEYKNIKLEIGASFSSVVPIQHHLNIGYVFGENFQVTPLIGLSQYFYGSDKEMNYSNLSAGLEIGKIINLEGKKGLYLIEEASVFAKYFGKFGGLGLKIIL